MTETRIGEFTIMSSSKTAKFVQILNGSELFTVSREDAEELFRNLRAKGLTPSTKSEWFTAYPTVAAQMQTGDY